MRRVVPVNPDLAFLILRLVLGAVMLAHGFPKVTGFAGTAGFFASAGVPAPTLAAAYAAAVEVGGGVLILLGIAVDIVGLLFAIDMLGAIIFVHIKNGFTAQGGYEFPLILLAASLAVALAGPGAYSMGGRK
jgi:putative oxidoreductase